MDKNAIKKYAVWAREELIERVSQKVDQYEISADADPNADSAHGVLLTPSEKKQRVSLITRVKDKGMDQVIEEVAYTWFNRFAALRFMEVNNYLPSRVRVFTDEEGAFKPEILTEAIHLELKGLDMEKVYALKEANDDEALFKYLIIAQCNALSSVLPGMFQKIADYTELLFPDNLLREGSVVERMITDIPEKDWNVSEGGQIEIIGWLYQYYISEKHDKVVDPLHGKVVEKNEVPAATQLFTTDWVVRYIIDNSVGRYWIERNPESNLKNELEYFVTPKDGIIPQVNEKITPEQLTVFDPCMGSAHFGVYAFDVLEKIYTEYGYTEREAAAYIVQNNLFGLDIDERAAQLANFAIMMKAMQYDKRFLSRGIQPHFYEIMESNHIDSHTVDYFSKGNAGLKHDIQSIINDTKDAKEYGSIIQIAPVDFDALFARFDEIEKDIDLRRDIALRDLLPLVREAKILSEKYAVVTTNPPYLNKFDAKLKKYIVDNYVDYKGDLFSVFIYRNFGFCKKNGYSGFMTPMVWMFIKTYEPLRNFVLRNKAITTLIQFEYSAFEEATVPICSFVLKNGKADRKGEYFRLSDFTGGMEVQRKRVKEALENPGCGFFYESAQSNFSKILGSPLAYWASEKALMAYKSKTVSTYMDCKSGIMTGSDEYIKLWHEPEFDSIKFDCHSYLDMGDYKWFPLNSGGGFRKWFGNNSKIVNLQYDGAEIKRNVKNYRLREKSYYFKEGITWGRITSAEITFREAAPGTLFGDAGPIGFINNGRHYLLGFLSSNVVKALLQFTNPTLNFQVHDIMDLPLIVNKQQEETVSKTVMSNIEMSKIDWDSFETSWDFQRHPLIRSTQTIKEAFTQWERGCTTRFNQLKANEEELNRIFIDIYGLQDELTPEEDDKDVTVRRADLGRDIRSFVSYAVGCMMGRYSLDVDGLAYAGGDWDSSKYKTFIPDKDAIIPITDDEYFKDDIVGRFVDFVRTVYGTDTLEENLKFIADALGEKGSTSREVIRNYFLNDFYRDHCKTYQKRPIYWLFDSGKKNGFKCLIYMHRYQPDTIARIRTDYVHEQQARYRTAISGLERQINGASTSERVRLNKQLEKLKDQAEETRLYEEKIHHLADQMISIDLDDGVKHNYAIFQDVLAKIK
ncbi:BREX-1 system adenine-specific DNA-methyltransferase PglX [uncultured Dialister sp.]|uniref:BREX-1 system adenine-specific DNA-methyltransferase PglX n=2 Tax=Bacteria TaxID=2 RepID=UPI002673178D|nr:BREX-1 system adenine-specific DNA-methyltransferase PglX [uncultured Dialister sp.]